MDKKAIACNYAESISECRQGAVAYVQWMPGSGNRAFILARSRSGRWIEKYEAIYRLHNFRVKTIPPEHPVYDFLYNETISPDFLLRMRLCWLRETIRQAGLRARRLCLPQSKDG